MRDSIGKILRRSLAPLPACVAAAVAIAAQDVPAAADAGADAGREIAERIDGVIAKVQQRKLRSDEHTPWVIMHAAIAFGEDAAVVDAETGESVPAIEHLVTRAKHDGQTLFRIEDGVPVLPRVPEVEHHPNEYLMMLALAGVSPDRALVAAGPDGDETLRVADLVEAAKRGFHDGQEVGWTLVALAHYDGFDTAWTTHDGRTCTIADVLRLGIAHDPPAAVEVGSHHLFGVAYAYRHHARVHPAPDPLSGGAMPEPFADPHRAWQDARWYLFRQVATVRRFQLEDGAFSAGFLEEQRPAALPSELVSSTGHTLEWLTFALSPDELSEAWVQRAVLRLCAEIEQHPLDTFSDGGIYHAVNALRLYRSALAGR